MLGVADGREPRSTTFIRGAATGGVRPGARGALKVAIADDHAVVRTGYRRLLELEEDVDVVAEFGDGESACRWLAANPADVLILDLSMPGRGGLAALERLRRCRPDLRVMVFTMHESAALATQALRLGAFGYLTKSSPPEALIDAIREVRGGGRPLSGAVLDAARRSTCTHMPHTRLTTREFEVFLLLAEGLGVEEIARRRCVSGKTIANCQTTIRNKTGLCNALEMNRYAHRNGLLQFSM